MAEKPNILGIITKVVFIGGAIVLFIILAFLIIQWIPKAINGISNMGSNIGKTISGGDKIDIKTNKSEVISGESFLVSWEYSPEKPGEYHITYSCENSLLFDIQSANGNKRLICDTPFRLGENINQVSLIPNLSKANILIDSTIKVFYKDFEKRKDIAKGEILITLKNTEDIATASNPFDVNLASSSVDSETVDQDNSTPNTTNTTTQYYNYGKPDLRIENIITAGDSALSFTAYNRGTNYTGNWYFSYTDAANPDRTILSPLQISLGPNQGLFTTVRFNSQKYNQQNITVYLDSTNSVNESNESNNTASITIYGNDDSNYYYNNNDYDEDADADLAIEDLEVGYMRGSRFVENDNIDEDERAAIRFVVKNIGGESTGRWRFKVTNTPYDKDDTYESRREDSLRPGEEKEFIVEFDNPDEGSYNIRVEVDSDDDVDEENERNNTESERLRVER